MLIKLQNKSESIELFGIILVKKQENNEQNLINLSEGAFAAASFGTIVKAIQ